MFRVLAGLFIISVLFFTSCRYSTPVFKVAYRKDTALVEEDGRVLKHYWSHYHYFRISRYGIVGNYSKHYYYDSVGVLVKMHMHKISAMVNDGYAIHHEKTKEYNADGKLILKKYSTLKERGWYCSKRREKFITYKTEKEK